MYFKLTTLFALLSAPLLAFAAEPNPFKIPASGLSATGGKPLTIQWTPTTAGTISLILRSGASNDLEEGTTIVSNYANSGSYTWTPSNSLTRGSDYTIEIVSDSDPSETNFTPYFVLDTDTTTPQNTSTVTLGAASSSLSLSSASATGSATSVTASTTHTGGPPRHNTFTNKATMTSGSASPGSSGLGASSSNGAAFQSSTSQGSGARATAMAMLGAVAFGALAL